jgi:acetolactate synthase I/II/III large subunit
MSLPPLTGDTVAGVIARFLKAQGVTRVFALCGGHIMPIWMRLDAEGIQIVDVRDERAAVYMAHAHGALTGEPGVALVTAGPGTTNAMTGIANAHVARAPVIVLSGIPPRQQENRGALQDMVHIDFVKPITRYARTVREASLVLPELREAVSRSQGEGGDPGPVYLDFPTDTLRDTVPRALQRDEFFRPLEKAVTLPDPTRVEAAADLLLQAKRPLVISGRGAMGCGPELRALLDKTGAAYLDTGESKGLVPDSHPSVVGAVRGTIMGDSDLIVTVGRKLDFQLAYGSPAVFGEAKLIRMSDSPAELRDNRRADVELYASTKATLQALADAIGDKKGSIDREWIGKHRQNHEARVEKFSAGLRSKQTGSDGRIHPNWLIAELREQMPKDSVVVADGGDFLSFARVGLPAQTYLDPGPLGCIGVGTPFGVAASLARPDQMTIVATGDGAFGFNAMEIDTAVRHKAPLLVVVANNGAWQIEVRDQQETHGRVVGTALQFADHAAMARGFGMHAERVEKPEDLAGAIKRAMANRPALLDVVVTPDAASSDSKSGLAWVPDLQPLQAWDDAERAWRESKD